MSAIEDAARALLANLRSGETYDPTLADALQDCLPKEKPARSRRKKEEENE